MKKIILAIRLLLNHKFILITKIGDDINAYTYGITGEEFDIIMTDTEWEDEE